MLNLKCNSIVFTSCRKHSWLLMCSLCTVQRGDFFLLNLVRIDGPERFTPHDEHIKPRDERFGDETLCWELTSWREVYWLSLILRGFHSKPQDEWVRYNQPAFREVYRLKRSSHFINIWNLMLRDLAMKPYAGS